ncbi:hypothetical protein WMY93_004799 [Mugilogobius chulae]|uniref:BTB domain-containing protein n=1 Tax=Mugilogobius chulae TaxID=88201 RepID=A0AAW0PT64_9GOBI
MKPEFRFSAMAEDRDLSPMEDAPHPPQAASADRPSGARPTSAAFWTAWWGSDRPGMFAGGLRETQQNEIPIHGVTHVAMKKILDYIYTSEIELDLECVQEVLVAATLFQLEIVIGFCCDFLYSWLDETNILEVHHLAEMYELKQLKARVHSYILKNIQSLSRADMYRQLPQEQVYKALSSNELQVSSENEVYEAALHFHFSPEQVETDQVYLQDNLKMLETVRFCLIEKHILERLHSRLSPCPLRDLVSEALKYHELEILQPVRQSPLTQPRSTLHCILGFGGMFCSIPYIDPEPLFQVYHPSWGEWKTLSAAPGSQMSNQGIAVLNNFAYLIGGDKNTRRFRAETRCWRISPPPSLLLRPPSLVCAHAEAATHEFVYKDRLESLLRIIFERKLIYFEMSRRLSRIEEESQDDPQMGVQPSTSTSAPTTSSKKRTKKKAPQGAKASKKTKRGKSTEFSILADLLPEDMARVKLLHAERMKSEKREPGLIFDILSHTPDPPPPGPPNPEQLRWCVCSNCKPMPTLLEQKCCGETVNCISMLPHMDLYIVQVGVLRLARRVWNDLRAEMDAQELGESHRQFRYAAYRQFVVWRYGVLGPGNRIVIPSCCVWKIRRKFPDPHENYVGFIPSRV